MYFWSNMLDGTLCHHHQTPNEGICFGSMLFIHPSTWRMEKSTEAALEDGSVETREAVCLEMDGFETNGPIGMNCLVLLKCHSFAMLSSAVQCWDNWSTDRRHGQQVIRSHSDIISKLVKLVVAFSVELEELYEVKNYHGHYWLLCIQRKICMAQNPVLTFCMGSIKFRSYTMKPSTPALISSSFSLRGGRKQHHSGQHGSIKTWSHIFEYRNRHCNWTLMIPSTMRLVNMM